MNHQDDLFIVEKTHNLNDAEQTFIDQILSDKTPYYCMGTVEGTEEFIFAFSHILMHRNNSDTPETGIINSPFYEDALKLFDRFCVENKITYQHIFRAAINITWNNVTSSGYGCIHKDHSFPHYNFLMYLNDFDDGHTFIFDDDNHLIKTITPSKNKIAIFDGKLHAQGFCRLNQRRVVLVITFK
jgi:hypothetical protein